MTNKAIIVGSNGQDGTLIGELLTQRGYWLIGIDRPATFSDFRYHEQVEIDIKDKNEVGKIVRKIQPDEIYFLAAYHSSSEESVEDDHQTFTKSLDVNVISLINFLDAVVKYSSGTRIFYAASSHIFGQAHSSTQNELTSINPANIYGISKAAGLYTCRYYRNKFSIFVSVGILYNHESKYRQDKFITRKIIKNAVLIKKGLCDEITVGDPSAKVDWGYAPDYVEAMRLILSLNRPDDFIIATGESHTVEEFMRIAFECLELNYKEFLKTNSKLLPEKKTELIGNPEKLKELTGWKPSLTFKEMIKKLVRDEWSRNNE